MNDGVEPFCLSEVPSLIERLLPVQKLSAEAHKEQMAGSGKTLTPLGSYWKGRKPLVVAKACILGCLLPATDDPERDLEIFEMLMAMDAESFVARRIRRWQPRDVLALVSLGSLTDYFIVDPPNTLPRASPVDWARPEYQDVKVEWRPDIPEAERRRIESLLLPKVPYRQWVSASRRAEEVGVGVSAHIWDAVNAHLGTTAQTFPDLVRQLGVMRFGHPPRVADTFCGSGQIPFEAARLGADVYASDLNPVACMLTWGSFNIIGCAPEQQAEVANSQRAVVDRVRREIDELRFEPEIDGWRPKVFLYCAEARCPQTGWMVPLLPSLVISQPRTGTKINVIAQLVADSLAKRYEIKIRAGVTDAEVAAATRGTVRTDGRGQEPYMVHSVDGIEYRTKISSLRGDFRGDASNHNRLRPWERLDFKPTDQDVFQERLYCIQWLRTSRPTKGKGRAEPSVSYQFRQVTPDDAQRERSVAGFLSANLEAWQAKGWLPDMRIEAGYNTNQLIRERGWTYWHHLFNPRQLLVAGLVAQFSDAEGKFGLAQLLNWNSRLCRWNVASGGGGSVQDTFYNQALNTLLTYGCRAFSLCSDLLITGGRRYPLPQGHTRVVENCAVTESDVTADVFITDPPYGDAVNYDEILDFFIAWLRRDPPPEFSAWTWDSRRPLAIKGSSDRFRRGMVDAYSHLAARMPENGVQVIMFTHQSGSIWADMANIVWASGLRVTAAWYVATETDSPLREGSYVKGTVLLVLRKRRGFEKTTRDDLAWEIQEEVESQVLALTGLNQSAKGLYRDESVFEDADIQMAGYAAALRVLTRYSAIDGRDMTSEAIRPRIKGQITFVDGLIAFAVNTANQSLVPQGMTKAHWDKLRGAERFYLKMLDLEARGAKTLDNYQNFAKAFKVRDFRPFLASLKANGARLKSSTEFGRSEMGEGSELHQSVLRCTLYAMMELSRELDGDEVTRHLALNLPQYYTDMTQRTLCLEIAAYLANRLATIRPEEARNARVLYELIMNQRLG